MSGGGGGGTTTQIVQNYSPEEVARRTRLQDEAERIYNAQRGAYGSYPGSPPIAPSAETLAAEDYLRSIVPGQIQTSGNLHRAMNFGLGDVLYAESNPYLQSAMQAAIRPITQSYVDPGGVMAQIRQNAVEAGQYGGSRQGIAEGIAAGRYAQTIGDKLAQMASEGYGQGLDTFGRTMALSPAIMQTQLAPAQTLASVGASDEERRQELADFQEAQRMWKLNAPWIPLQNYANMIYGGGSSGGTVTSKAPGMTAGQRLIGGISGGLAGYALGSSLAGTAVGSSAAAALGLSSLAPPLAILGVLAGAGLF